MDQVNQLKTMRDDAWARIRAMPDYKLATSLDSLISDLESALVGKSSKSGKSDSDKEESESASDDAVEPSSVGAATFKGATEADKAEKAAEEIEDDVMSELTQMIHAGIGADAAEEAGAVTAESAEDDSGKNVKLADVEAIEQDAILRAMKALDEDLSSGLELVSDSDGDFMQAGARKR